MSTTVIITILLLRTSGSEGSPKYKSSSAKLFTDMHIPEFLGRCVAVVFSSADSP